MSALIWLALSPLNTVFGAKVLSNNGPVDGFTAECVQSVSLILRKMQKNTYQILELLNQIDIKGRQAFCMCP